MKHILKTCKEVGIYINIKNKGKSTGFALLKITLSAIRSGRGLRSGLGCRMRNCLPACRLATGLEKTRVFLTQPSGFFWFFWVFWVFGVFGFFGCFWVFLFRCPEERVFRVFSLSRILLGASRL